MPDKVIYEVMWHLQLQSKGSHTKVNILVGQPNPTHIHSIRKKLQFIYFFIIVSAFADIVISYKALPYERRK